MLEEPERQPLDREPGVSGEGDLGVGSRAKAVHQQQRNRAVGALTKGEDLARDEIDERRTGSNLDQRFRSFEPHAGAQTAVQLDDGHTAQRVVDDVRIGVDGSRFREIGDGLDLPAVENPGLARQVSVEVEPERVDRDLRHS